MAARSIASLSLSFGLVSIPVRLFSATEGSATVSFNLLTKEGSRVKQQYVSVNDGKLEYRGQLDSALDSYERCLAIDPRLADAHFNAARLHEQLGHAQKALRHFSVYRRLQR